MDRRGQRAEDGDRLVGQDSWEGDDDSVGPELFAELGEIAHGAERTILGGGGVDHPPITLTPFVRVKYVAMRSTKVPEPTISTLEYTFRRSAPIVAWAIVMNATATIAASKSWVESLSVTPKPTWRSTLKPIDRTQPAQSATASSFNSEKLLSYGALRLER